MKQLNIIFLPLLLLFGDFGFAQQEISLNGDWEIVFDHQNEGAQAMWHQNDVFQKLEDKRKIKVPSSWELIEQDYEGVAFYRYAFAVPQDWQGKVIRLQFDAVNYLSEIWLNGKVVGYHEGGFTPFEFRVDKMIEAGKENILTLRVVGPILLSDKNIEGVTALQTPQWRGGISGGVWQNVRLVSSGDTYIKEVFVEPNIHDNTATFHFILDHTAIKTATAEIEFDLSEASNPKTKTASKIETLQVQPGLNQYKVVLEIPNAQYWSHDDPFLYLAKVKLKNKQQLSEEWHHRFGLRELTIKNQDFYLNGKRIFIKATFFEGLYPNGIAYPDSEEMVRKEIRLAKEAGFNMIRPWRHPTPPFWLDLADEMGIMVVGSPALECMGLPLSSPYLPSRVRREIEQTILKDRNRTCIVQWELFNELHRPVLNQLMRPMAMLTRELDPSRLILDESGGWAFGANMYLPYQREPTKFNDIHNYAGAYINENIYNSYVSMAMTKEEKKAMGLEDFKMGGKSKIVPGMMSFLSELGYGSLAELVSVNKQFQEKGNPLTPAYRYHKRLHMEQQQMLVETGLKSLYPDMKQFYLEQQHVHGTANKRMIEAIRSNPHMDGYCVHALTGGDWILGAGLLDLWRNPKSYAYEATKAANQPRIVSIRTFSRNVYAHKGMTLMITGINDLEAVEAYGQISIQSKEGIVVYEKAFQSNWKSGISSFLNQKIDTKKWKGQYTVKVKVKDKNNALLTQNFIDFEVFNPRDLKAPRGRVALLDFNGKLKKFLQKNEVQTVDFNSRTPKNIPVLVSTHKAENEKELKHFERLLKFVESGGTAVFLDRLKDSVTAENTITPFTAKVHPSKGLWTCIPHIANDHPVFDGLQDSGFLRNTYENIWPQKSLRDIKVNGLRIKEKPIVASIAFDWFSRGHKMGYQGPGASWWGADMTFIPIKKGHYLLSQFQLLENLGKDPVADKMLFNIITFLSTQN
jgi:beta-galactosidase